MSSRDRGSDGRFAPAKSGIPLATLFEDLFRPLMLRNCCLPYQQQFREAIDWLAKVLARPPLVADLEKFTLELALQQLAKAELGQTRLKAIRKRWLALWRYAEKLGWAGACEAVALPRAVPTFRPWTQTPPPAGSLLHFYRSTYRPELLPRTSGKEVCRYDQAVNHFHDFAGVVALADVTPELIENFRTWLEGLAVTAGVRRQLRGAIVRIMRAAAPSRFPPPEEAARPDSAAPRRMRHGPRLGKLPLLAGEPGTVVYFYVHSFVPDFLQGGRERYDGLMRKLRRCFGRELRLDELKRETMARFLAWLDEAGASPLTRRHLRSALSSVWRYANELGQADPVPQWRKMKIPRQQPDAWSLEEAAKIVAATDRLKRPPIADIDAGKFWRALLLVGWYTGLRRSSLFKIECEHVDLGGSLYVPAANMKNAVGQRFALGEDAIAAIVAILHPARELLFPVDARQHSLGQQFNALLNLAGVERGDRLPNSLFHKWRRTVATHTAVRAGMAAAVALLGHSLEDMTKRYIDPSYIPGNDATAWLPSLTDIAKRNNLNSGDDA